MTVPSLFVLGSFTRRIIQTLTHDNGNKEHTVQFCLTCEPDFFLTTDVNRQLELKVHLYDLSAKKRK